MPQPFGHHAHLLCDINRIEMIQRRSARFVYNDFARTSSVTSMMKNLGWPLLRQRRDVAKVTMFFKIINNLIFIPHGHVSVSSAPTCGHNQKFIQFAAKTMYICSLFSPWRSSCETLCQTVSLILLF